MNSRAFTALNFQQTKEYIVKKLIVLILALLSVVAAFFAGRYALNKGIDDVKADIEARWQMTKRTVIAWFTVRKRPEAA